MADLLEVNAELRELKGKGASRRLRKLSGKVPAIIYGGGEEATPLTLEHKDLMKSLENEAFYSSILSVTIGGKKQKAILKALQRHPVKRQILHADFLRVTGKEVIVMNVPLHFMGEDVAPGVKTASGIITHHMTELEIKCLPKDLPEFIEVDVSAMEITDSLHLADIKLPKNVELTAELSDDNHNSPVISINEARVVEEPVEEEPVEGAESEATDEEEADKPDEKKK